MPWFLFQWSDKIVEHLEEHDIAPEDFEYVVMNPAEQVVSRSTGRQSVFGYLPDGRYVFAVYDLLDDVTVVPRTCYEVDED